MPQRNGGEAPKGGEKTEDARLRAAWWRPSARRLRKVLLPLFIAGLGGGGALGANASQEEGVLLGGDVAAELVEQRRLLDTYSRRLDEQESAIKSIMWFLFRQQEAMSLAPGRGSAGPGPLLYFAQNESPGIPQVPVPVPPKPVAPIERPPDEDAAGPEPVPPVKSAVPEGGESVLPEEAERPKSERPQEQLLLEQGAILLPAGTLQLEPGIDYARSSSNRVAISGISLFEAIVIGTIRVDELDRDIVTASLTGRHGITDRIQIDVRVPGVYRKDDEILGVGTADQSERTIDNIGLGDVEASLLWQAFLGEGSWPALIVRVRSRFPTGENPFEIETVRVPGTNRVFLTETPTGAGFYSGGSGLTAVWRSDPVVFFTGISYLINFERRFDRFGDINPGDTFEIFGGLNLALNERIAINMSFVDQITDSTKVNGVESPGSDANDARLTFGTSIGLGASTSLLISASAGLTEEAPDFQLVLSVPMIFELF